MHDPNKTILDIFTEFCIRQNWQVEKKIQEFSDLIYYPEATHFRNNAKAVSYSTLSNGTPENKRRYIHYTLLLNAIYNIPYEDFGFNHEDESFSKFFFQESKKSATNILNLKIKDKTIYKTAFEKALSPFQYMSESLYIYDYLEKQSYKEQKKLTPYFEAHAGIYRQIEKQLHEVPDFEYARFLSLPLHFDKFPDNYLTLTQENQYNLLLLEIVDLASMPLFEHICRCLYRFEDYFKKRDCVFFLIANAPRGYSWGIIDSGQYILSEYYRYNRNGICFPDILFVERHTNELAEIYKKETIDLREPDPDKNTRNPPIRFNTILDALKRLEIRARKAVSESEVKSESEQLLSGELKYEQRHLEKILEKLKFFEKGLFRE